LRDPEAHIKTQIMVDESEVVEDAACEAAFSECKSRRPPHLFNIQPKETMLEQEAPDHVPAKSQFVIVGVTVAVILIAMLAVIGLSGCTTLQKPHRIAETKSGYHHTTRARITFYTGLHERVAVGGRAVQGVSVAAHPSYPFHTKVCIPDLYQYLGDAEYEVQDRGSAVTSRKASHGTADVFDIYVRNTKILRWLEADAPEYMEVQL
jgi:hypothetical protein